MQNASCSHANTISRGQAIISARPCSLMTVNVLPSLDCPLQRVELTSCCAMVHVRYGCPLQAGKLMAKRGPSCGGRIVTISSVHGLGGTHYNAIYGSSKAAVIALTRGAAFDLADHGIRVNSIAPGAVPVPNDTVPTSRYAHSLQLLLLKHH